MSLGQDSCLSVASCEQPDLNPVGFSYAPELPWVQQILAGQTTLVSDQIGVWLPASIPAGLQKAIAQALQFRRLFAFPLIRGDAVVGALSLILTEGDPEQSAETLFPCVLAVALALNKLYLSQAANALGRLAEAVDDKLELALQIEDGSGTGKLLVLSQPAGIEAGEALDDLFRNMAPASLRIRAGSQPASWRIESDRRHPNKEADSAPAADQPSSQTEPLQLVLLVESNPVSRQLMRSTLENRGWPVIDVTNPEEAVNQMAQQEVGLALVNFELDRPNTQDAIERIRQKEWEAGLHSPIFALTAEDGREEQLCILQADFDGQLTVPVRPLQLIELAERVLAPLPPTDSLDILLDTLGDDKETLQEIIELFLHHYPKHLKELTDALAAGDANVAMRAAHTIKGECAQFGNETARQVAYELEQMGQDDNLEAAPTVLSTLRVELARLTAAIRRSELFY